MIFPDPCPDCGRLTVMCELLDPDTRERSGVTVLLDATPSLHGRFRRASVVEALAIEDSAPGPGRYRPHSETCKGGL